MKGRPPHGAGLMVEKLVPAWRKFLAQFQDVLVTFLLIATVISTVLWLSLDIFQSPQSISDLAEYKMHVLLSQNTGFTPFIFLRKDDTFTR